MKRVNEKNTNRPNSSIRKTLTNSESLFYIYTSGTTGLPKASNFSHQKFAVGSGLQMFSLNMKSTDKTYLVLPLYHATGGVVGLGSTLFTGGTVVLRKKFSVEKFKISVGKFNFSIAKSNFLSRNSKFRSVNSKFISKNSKF